MARLLAAALVLVGAAANAGPQQERQVNDLLEALAEPSSQLGQIDREAAEQRALSLPTGCWPGDYACRGRATGRTDIPSRGESAGRFGVPEVIREHDEDMPPGTCAQRVRVIVEEREGGPWSCLVDANLTREMATISSGNLTVDLTRPYFHLGAASGGNHGAPQWRSTTHSVYIDMSQLARVELALLGPSTKIVSVNGQNFRWFTTRNHGPICYETDIGCEPTTISRLENKSNDILTGFLVDGMNEIVLSQLVPHETGAGLMFRLRPRHGSGSWKWIPLCESEWAQGCEQTGERWCGQSHNGQCLRDAAELACYDVVGQESYYSCGPPVTCVDGLCEGGEGEDHGASLFDVVAKLEAGRQAASYVDRDDLVVFRGVSSTCRNKVGFGLGNCCRPSGSGGSTTNEAALANLGVSTVVRNVASKGSPHTHDLLFLSDDITTGLEGLGMGKVASGLSPSLSYYGLEVALTDGVLSFSFDPASFAIAIALSIIANMLECSQGEQVVSMRLAAGLCNHNGERCTKRRFFFCKERTRWQCCYNSRLAAALAGQMNEQLGHSSGRCEGFTTEELVMIDFSRIDIGAFATALRAEVDHDLLDGYRDESVEALGRSGERDKPWVHVE